MNLNQAAHGDREFGYIETRLGIPRKTVAGHASDPTVAQRIGGWVRAAAGRQAGQQLKLARFGDNMRDVAVTEGDKVEAQLRFGVSVNTYGVNELVARVDAEPDDAVNQLVKEYDEATGRPGSCVLAGASTTRSRRRPHRAGLRHFLDDGGFTAFTTNFQDLGGLRQLPGIAVQRLMADGYGFGGEGDWKTSVLLRLLKVRAMAWRAHVLHGGLNLPPRAGERRSSVPTCLRLPSIAAQSPSCEIHPLTIGDRADPVRLVFDAGPGPAFVVGMSDLGERFRFVANEVDVVPPDEPLPKLPVARAVWMPRPDLPTSTEAWLLAGGPHHTVLSSAVEVETLSDFADMVETELLLIDGDTTMRSFRNEVRWNQTYFRLARGF